MSDMYKTVLKWIYKEKEGNKPHNSKKKNLKFEVNK